MGSRAGEIGSDIEPSAQLPFKGRPKSFECQSSQLLRILHERNFTLAFLIPILNRFYKDMLGHAVPPGPI